MKDMNEKEFIARLKSEGKKRSMDYSTGEVTIKQLDDDVHRNYTNPDPIGQRPPVSEGWSKSIEIIKAILFGFTIGSITLRDIRKDIAARVIYPNVSFLVIDGGHRLRAIHDFMQGHFKVLGISYQQLRMFGMLDKFSDTKVQTISYICTSAQATEIFNSLNQASKTNEIEEIFANETSLFAKFVRSFVSYYKEYGNDVHKLFDTVSKNNGKSKPVYWSNSINPRRKWDELVSIITLKVIGGGNISGSLTNVRTAVDDDHNISKVVKKRVDKLLNYAVAVVEPEKRKYNPKSFGAFQAVYFELMEQSKNFTIENIEEFAERFWIANTLLISSSNVSTYNEETRIFRKSETKTDTQIVKDFATGAVSNFANPIEQRQIAKMYLDEMDLDYMLTNKIVIYLGDKRSESKTVKQDMLSIQRGVCYVDGLPLDIDDAEYGHNISYSAGGTDGYIIRKSHNRMMKHLETVDEYKKRWDGEA